MNECKCNEVEKTGTKPDDGRIRLVPVVTVNEDDNGYTLAVELPGVEESGIDLTVEDRTLMLTAKNAVAVPEGYTAEGIEIPPAEYHAVFELPERVGTEAISCKLDNGILTVLLPKKEEVKPRKIAVKTAD